MTAYAAKFEDMDAPPQSDFNAEWARFFTAWSLTYLSTLGYMDEARRLFDQLTGKETSNEALFCLSVTMQATGSELGVMLPSTALRMCAKQHH